MSEEIEIEYKQAAITPFWQKMPFFFLFPLRSGTLIFIGCLVAASLVAGFAPGRLGLMSKGFLVYLGLRYAFNVLELFAQGRFEGHSVDHTLWGPEKRPAKLGMLIVLYLTVGFLLGNVLVQNRVASNPAVQEQLLDLYKKDHADEIAQREREQAAFNERYGMPTASSPGADNNNERTADNAGQAGTDNGTAAGDNKEAEPGAASAEADRRNDTRPAVAPSPYGEGVTREDILFQYQPKPPQPLWFKLLPAWYWLLMGVLSLMLPAAAIVIALEDRFFKALNPAHVIFLVKAMGSTYFVLWALFLAIAGARQFALTAGAGLPLAVRFPLEMGVSTYLALVLFAMMGYALYQYHQELSLDVAIDFDSHRKAGGAEAIGRAGSANAAIRAAEPSDPLERKVQALLAEGKVDEAIAEVKDRMRYDRYDADLNNRLHTLYVQKADQSITLAHGQQWITALARANRGKAAFDALNAMLAIDPGFTVQDGDAILPITQVAVQRREFEQALNLMRDFDKRYPKHKDTAALLYLNAKVASEYQRKHEKAVKLLRVVLTHFPEDPIVAEAKVYLHVLEKIMGQAGAANAG